MIGQTNDIKLSSPEKCTGCAACASICPTNSITMREDRGGFLQPHIDVNSCVGCHKCEKTCPVLNFTIECEHHSLAYNIQTNDKYALQMSSSGGAFYELSRCVICKGGVVFGVRFDGIRVIHDFAETLEGVEAFMGSKYVQSKIGDTYKQAKLFLEQDRWVLFTGTPCQIAGLHSFLNKKYEKLLTVDLICHGVPSPGIWERHISRLMKRINAGDIKDIRFRVKPKTVKGWNNFYFFFFFFFLRDRQWHSYGADRTKDPFYSYFSRHIFRPSCYHCQYRGLDASCADLTIGDAVGEEQFVNKDLPSTILIHSSKGQCLLDEIKAHLQICEQIHEDSVNRYYEIAKEDEKKDCTNRMWRLSNRLAMIFPLESIDFIWMHDKPLVVLRRKINKLCQRNIK